MTIIISNLLLLLLIVVVLLSSAAVVVVAAPEPRGTTLTIIGNNGNNLIFDDTTVRDDETQAPTFEETLEFSPTDDDNLLGFATGSNETGTNSTGNVSSPILDYDITSFVLEETAAIMREEEEKPGFEAQTGTNFQSREAYNFTHIIMIGGHCTIENDWYSKFVKAAVETMPYVTKVLCAQEGEDQYSLQFHMDKLEEVKQLVGDKLNETLVITVAIGLETVNWKPVADLLRQGMAFFHAKEDSLDWLDFNLTEHNLSPDKVLYYYFRWDEDASAKQVGVELCRLKAGKELLKVAKFYKGGRNGSMNYRVDVALESFRQSCPDTEVIEVWEMYYTDSRDNLAVASKLLYNQMPDVVLTCDDYMSRDILGIAEQVLTEEEYSRFTTTGWANDLIDLLDEQKILTTVEQQLHAPNVGLWKVIDSVVKTIQQSGLNSTEDIRTALDLNSLTISSETMAISSDSIGFLTNRILGGYDGDTPPRKDVQVSTGLYDVTITEFVPFEGKFQVVLWLRESWYDQRLKWNPAIGETELPIDSENIWTPSLYLKNGIEQEELYRSPAKVTFEGYVLLETNIVADILCSTTEELSSFPFDSYNCAIDLGASTGVILDQRHGFHVIESDPHFDTTESLDARFNANGTTKTTTTTTSTSESSNDSARRRRRRLQTNSTIDEDFVAYNLHFHRLPFTAYVRLILPAIVINMVGFMAFWIPEVPESVALGITSLLCSLAFRETVDMPDTASITWTELFMMVNIGYQASVMFIIWCTYGNKQIQSGMAAVSKKFAKATKMDKAAKAVVKAPKKVVKMAASRTDRLRTSRRRNSMDKTQELSLALKTIIPENDMVVPANDMVIPENDMVIPANDMVVPANDMVIPENDMVADAGELEDRMKAAGQEDQEDEYEDEDQDINVAPMLEEVPEQMPEQSTAITKHIRRQDTGIPKQSTDIRGSTLKRRLRSSTASSTTIPLFSRSSTLGSYSEQSANSSQPPIIIPLETIHSRGSLGGDESEVEWNERKEQKKRESSSGRHGDYDRANVATTDMDWVGRWIVVPSYIIVTATLLTTGWGYK